MLIVGNSALEFYYICLILALTCREGSLPDAITNVLPEVWGNVLYTGLLEASIFALQRLHSKSLTST